MKKILLPMALIALMGQGCLSAPAPAPAPIPLPPVPSGEAMPPMPAENPVPTAAPAPVPAPEPAAMPQSSDQNMPPQENTAPLPSPGASTYNVVIQNFAYAPASITVKKGDKILFLNRDSAPHTITSDAAGFDSGLLNQGQTWELDTADLAAGSYPYHCTVHSMMHGTIIVK